MFPVSSHVRLSNVLGHQPLLLPAPLTRHLTPSTPSTPTSLLTILPPPGTSPIHHGHKQPFTREESASHLLRACVTVIAGWLASQLPHFIWLYVCIIAVIWGVSPDKSTPADESVMAAGNCLSGFQQIFACFFPLCFSNHVSDLPVCRWQYRAVARQFYNYDLGAVWFNYQELETRFGTRFNKSLNVWTHLS